MIRRVSLLGLAGAVAAIALALAISSGPTHAVGGFEVPDPLGDTLGKGPYQHDIVLVSGSTDGANLILTVQFEGAISPPSPEPAATTFGAASFLGGEPSAGLYGYVDFDTDQNPGTELRPELPQQEGIGISGLPTNDHVTQWCPDPSGMGVDAFLNVGDYDSGSGTAPIETADAPVAVPVSFGATSFTATIPLSAIGGDINFNFGMVLGNNLEPTDCAPDDGGNIKPDLSKQMPTETPQPTPTGTVPPPEPSATVAATVIAPDTGRGGATGSTPVLPWVLVAAGALACASAAVWAYRRRAA